MFKHLMALVILCIFAGIIFQFGKGWTPGIWALVVLAFLVFALTIENPKVAKDLIEKLPAILAKFNPFGKKK